MQRRDFDGRSRNSRRAGNWAGSPRLAPYRKTAFAVGGYVVEYVDKAECSGDFAARHAHGREALTVYAEKIVANGLYL